MDGTKIKFIVDGEVYAERRWWNVPPKGSHVLLGCGKRYKPHPASVDQAMFKVLDVLYWGGGIDAPFNDSMGNATIRLKALSERLPDESP